MSRLREWFWHGPSGDESFSASVVVARMVYWRANATRALRLAGLVASWVLVAWLHPAVAVTVVFFAAPVLDRCASRIDSGRDDAEEAGKD